MTVWAESTKNFQKVGQIVQFPKDEPENEKSQSFQSGMTAIKKRNVIRDRQPGFAANTADR